MSEEVKYSLSTEVEKLDLNLIHSFLTDSYWAKGIPKEVVARSIQHSLCFGAYDADGNQVGFARAITDRATFAYLADVFVLDAHRGKGVSRLLMDAYETHPELQGLRSHMLATGDAHGLYKKYGFEPVAQPEIWMQKHDPEVYK